MAKTWYVYIVRCRNQSLYCGIAKDPEQRFQLHASGKGARYTRAHGAEALIFQEGPYEHGDALRREMQIKKLPRLAKERLLQSQPPEG